MSTKLAYFAGFFDGEGCIGTWKHNGGHYFRMLIGNTNRDILESFVEEFGGSIYEKSRHSPLTKKTIWVWTVSGETAWDCYYKMEPYLREKRWKQEPKG